TDNNADAWFVGANEEITVAVWVGYPDGATPMTTEYGGQPVDGGTIPALLWSDIVAAYDEIVAARRSERASKQSSEEGEDIGGYVPPAVESAPQESASAPTPEPAPEPEPAPTPAEPAPPSDGGGGGDGGGGVGAAPG